MISFDDRLNKDGAGESVSKVSMLVIVGPTASGKSDLAVQVAKSYNGEIICADSLTVRKHLNIGSAKPTLADQAKVKHYLLDVAEPCKDFTAANFKRLATKAIDDIQKKGKLPILVGGTGLYIDAVLFDFAFLPPGDRSQRQKFNKLSLENLLRLVADKGLSTDGIDTRNKRRLIRLLETDGAKPTRHPMSPDTLIVGINPASEVLQKRVDSRVHEMVEAGLKQEVKALSEKYGWECEGLKAIGYQEWHAYFEGQQTIEQIEARIIKSTKDLVKRQHTWFKRNQHINWFTTPEQVYGFLKRSVLGKR